MSMTKRTLLTSGATMALATVAVAQQGSPEAENNLLSHEVLLVEPSGHMMKKKANATGIAMAQKYGQKVPTAYAMVYRDGNDHYLVTNQKLDDGSMLFDHRDEWYDRN
jgi:hypothetical protein